ncbi:MAG TPA: hypothetical protein VFF98_08580, partial [Novosphingobium sp.]|nr:hypothetical protein [Novosphingobium sp.]
MSDKPEPPRPDYTSIGAYVSGGLARAGSAARATLANIPWDQPATMIDLDGRTPIIGTIRECAQHFGLYKPEARAQARIVLTKPVH